MEGKTKRGTLIFSCIAVISGWLGVLLDMVLTKQPKGNSLGMLVWLVLPLLSGVLIRVFNKDGCKSFGFKPNIKGNLKWYLVSFFIFPLIAAIVIAIGAAAGWVDLSKFNSSSLIAAFFAVFVGNFIKNIFEEFAWRGFLTERMLQLKMSNLKIYGGVVIVWGMWHIPYYLYLLSNQYIHGSRIALVGINFIVLSCWTMLFTELYRLTRTSWPCVMLHTVVNSLVVINDYISIASGKSLFFAYDSGVISLLLCAGAGILLRTYRLQNTKQQLTR